jgi:hypothetical protein
MLHQEFETAFNQVMLKEVSKAMNSNRANPREGIEELLLNMTKYNQVLLDFVISVLKEVDYKLLNEKGEFKKVGIFQWKNIADYVAFAGFVKDKIVDVKNQIEK